MNEVRDIPDKRFGLWSRHNDGGTGDFYNYAVVRNKKPAAPPPAPAKNLQDALDSQTPNTSPGDTWQWLLKPMDISNRVDRLFSLYHRSIDSLPENEIKAELDALRKVDIKDLSKIATLFGVDGRGTKKADILRSIDAKLKATYRAKLEARV